MLHTEFFAYIVFQMRLASEGGATGVEDAYSHKISGLCFPFREDHYFVLRCASEMLVGTALRPPFYKHLHLLAHIPAVAFRREPRSEGQSSC